jgi:hypothetical protein
MIPKKLALAKAGVADFSDKIMRKIKENREARRASANEKPRLLPGLLDFDQRRRGGYERRGHTTP